MRCVVLGAGPPSDAPVSDDVMYENLSVDEADRWRSTIEADMERQSRDHRRFEPREFSQAYLALTPAQGRSGLMRVLGSSGRQ